MRYTQFFINTLRQAPAEAEVISHKLMVQGFMVRKLAAGIYTYLPLGFRVIRKIENIVRECMNEEGAVELLMPAVQPSELWQESSRWSMFGRELLRFKDRHDRDYCMGPTHEEVITDIVRSSIHSYKQLPINLYHIQTKFRDEVRPRFGIIRAREFIMKDAYSFDTTRERAAESYEKMRRAYCKIFDRCGLNYKMVDADSGAIGGSLSHEFMVLAQTGEDAVISCGKCSYAANIEKAVTKKFEVEASRISEPYREAYTPGVHTAAEVAEFLKVSEEDVIKTMIVKVDDKFIAVLVRGGHDVNLVKIKNYFGAAVVELAEPADIKRFSEDVGFSGPVGLALPVYADYAAACVSSAVTGGNKKDLHFVGVRPGVDFAFTIGDFRMALEGDICPHCGGKYEVARGIEVGHIFYLGTKYSNSMRAFFTDEAGESKPFEMGCYGIGVSRIAAAAIEQSHDGKGMIWPLPIAPFSVVVCALNTNMPEIIRAAEAVYRELIELGIEAIIDDRDERAGAKLSDADLVGYPVRVTIGKNSFAEGYAEVKLRAEKESARVKLGETAVYVRELINSFFGVH